MMDLNEATASSEDETNIKQKVVSCSKTYSDILINIKSEINSNISERDSSHRISAILSYKNNIINSYCVSEASQNEFNCEMSCCNVCQEEFCSKSDLENHFLTHFSPKPYECNICMKEFQQLSLLQVHLQTYHNSDSCVCEICEKQFPNSRNLKSHFIVHRRKPIFKCTICDLEFGKKVYLEGHFLIHTYVKPYKCNVCGCGFRRKELLERHNCKTACRPTTLRKKAFEKISHSKNSAKSFKCKTTNKVFSRNTTSQKHSIHHNTTNDTKPHECKICQKDFKDKNNLIKHLLIRSEFGKYCVH